MRVLIVEDEFWNRINVALGELQGKFSTPVVFELLRQEEAQQDDPEKFLAELEPHLAEIRARVPDVKPDYASAERTYYGVGIAPEPARVD